MRRKLLSLLLAVCAALPLAGCGGLDVGIIGGGDGPTEIILDGAGCSFEEPEDAPETDLDVQPAGPEALPEEEAAAINEDGTYNTKSEARNLGWTGGSVEQVAPGCAIGGDRFGNREGILPAAQGRSYYECDIGTIGESSRGAKRLVYSDDGLIYYTEDHYETFTLLYGEEAP